MPTLSVDNSVAGELVFTVIGTAGAGTVKYFKITGKCEQFTWVTAWSFAGDETSDAVELDPGAYVFLAEDSGGISNAYHTSVTDPDDPAVYRCRTSVANFIRSMALSKVQDRVYERRSPVDSNVTFPCVFVHLWDFNERDTGGGTNERTEWEYPVKVLIASRTNELNDEMSKEMSGWRQTILEAFDWFIPSDTDIQWTRSTPRSAFQKFTYPLNGGKSFELTGSEVIVKCVLRRPRGFP